jgi:taurine transport system permease protein
MRPISMRRRNALAHRLVRVAPVFLALFAWWCLGWTGVSTLKLPRIEQVASALALHWRTLAEYSLLTLARVVVGLVLGGVLGWGTGILMIFSRVLRDLLEPLAEMLRPVPPVVLVPFFILWFGLGTASQVLLVGLGSFMILLVSTLEAAAAVPRRYVLTAQSLGAGRAYALLKVVVPAIRPHLIGSLRVASGSAFGLTVVAEFLGAQGGLGYVIRNARVTLNTDTMLLASLLLGAEAVCLDLTLRWVWSRWTRWAESAATELLTGSVD